MTDAQEPETKLDRELVQRAVEGNREAQEILYEELTPEIQWQVGKMLRKWRSGSAKDRDLHQEIEDLVQEVWLAIYSEDGRFLREWQPEMLPLKGWIVYIGRITAAQHLRSPRSPWRQEPLSPDDIPELAAAPTADRDLLGRDLLTQVYLCLTSRFKPRDFLLFDLLFMREKGISEIAAVIQGKLDVVYQWKSRLGRRARRCYELLTDASQLS